MTGSYCSSCGAERAPGARFCASCGSAVDAPQAVAPQPAAPQYVPPPPPVPAPRPVQAAPQYVTAPPPVPAQPQYAAAQVPVPAAPQPYPSEQQMYAGPPAQPEAAPWSAVGPAGSPPAGIPGRNVVDRLLTGDWGGAAKAAALAVGVMTAISLIGMLLVTEGGIGFQETVALVFAGVCLAVGGDAFAEADVDTFQNAFGTSFTLGVLPLTVTLAGLGVLAWTFARQVRTSRPGTATDALLHGVRTALVFTAFFLPLSLLTRYTVDDAGFLGSGSLGVGVFSSIAGAFLFAVAALGLTWVLHSSTPMPARVRAFRDKTRAPLFGAVAVFSVGVLAVLVGLIYALIEEDGALGQIGAVVLAAGNGALASVLWSAGVPMNMEGGASTPLLGEFAASSSPSLDRSIDLFTFTDISGWFWLAPVLLLVTMVLVATALVVRQNTIEDARREGLRFAGALAAVAFIATLLLRIGVDGEATGSEFADFEFQAEAAADASLMFNPLFAAVVLGVWGVATGLLAPFVGARIGSGFVMGVRRRFGAATEPMPMPMPPMPTPPQTTF